MTELKCFGAMVSFIHAAIFVIYYRIIYIILRQAEKKNAKVQLWENVG